MVAAPAANLYSSLVSRSGRFAGLVTWTNTTSWRGASATPITRSSGDLVFAQAVAARMTPSTRTRSMAETRSCFRHASAQLIATTASCTGTLHRLFTGPAVAVASNGVVRSRCEDREGSSSDVESRPVRRWRRAAREEHRRVHPGVRDHVARPRKSARRSREGREARRRAEAQGRLRCAAAGQEAEAQRVPQGREDRRRRETRRQGRERDERRAVDREGLGRRRRRALSAPARRERDQVRGRGRAGQRSTPTADAGAGSRARARRREVVVHARRLYAHRGASAEQPENTMPAFERAV